MFMLTRWGSENFIRYECVPWNVLFLKLMHDYHLDEEVVEEILHLMIIIPLLYNVCHLVNVVEEIVRYVKHSESSEVHEEPDMIRIESRKPPLTGEVFRNDFHHGDISVKEMKERENCLFIILVSWFKIWLIVSMINFSFLKPFLSYIWDPCSNCNDISGNSEINPDKSDLSIFCTFSQNSKQPTCLKHGTVRGDAIISLVVTGSSLITFPPFSYGFFFGLHSSLVPMFSSSAIFEVETLV